MAYQLRYWSDVKKPEEYEVIVTSDDKADVWRRFYDLCDECHDGESAEVVEINA